MEKSTISTRTQGNALSTPAELMLRPFREFARLQASGGILLIVATFAALVWSNSPWKDSYSGLWEHTVFSMGYADHQFSMSVVHWVNNLLMALFFLLVGLEIKREILAGQLASARKAALPIVAACGGMIVPALIYAVINAGEPTLRGWGVPVATDIAFALGILALVGRRVPVSLKVFLASVAIADDIGALLVIAFFYSENLKIGLLFAAVGLVVLLAMINWLGFKSPAIYLLLGLVLWILVHESGVHATIAGVALAMTIPARATVPGGKFLVETRRSLDVFKQEMPQSDQVLTDPKLLGAVHAIGHACNQVEPPLQRVEHALHPWVAFLIIPVFALANAGVQIDGVGLEMASSKVAVGVALGLVFGKPIGIMLSSYLAVRIGVASLPSGVTWRYILGAACLGGIGFTMSLFIAHLAFGDPTVLNKAKIGILSASLVAAVMGWFILARAQPLAPRETGPR